MRLLQRNLVPLVFFVLCLSGMLSAEMAPHYLANEVMERVARNLFLVLSLIIPIVTGMGLNFGIVIGAMCGQVGLIVIENANGRGLGALFLAMLVSLPFSLLTGYLTGRLLNLAKGREMICGMILGFFANGIYQFIFLLMAGPVLPLHNPGLLLSGGVGLRNSIDLVGTRGQLDHLIRPFIPFFSGRIAIPIATLALIAILCFGIRWYLRTKSGQDLRAVGQDRRVAEIAGIGVDRARIRAMMISTALGAIGHILFLSNLGNMSTYQSHEQVGPYAIAALLVGGATVAHATIWHAIAGTLLFHTLFVVSPIAGQKLFGDAQIGEYLREFVGYAVIGVTLALNAWQTSRKKRGPAV